MSWVFHDDNWTNLDQYSEFCIFKESHGEFSIQMFLKKEEDGLTFHYLTEKMFKTKKQAVKYMNRVMETMIN